jgi:2'-5' RNA ligase
VSNLVIAAIPRDDDLVWKVSSETVPHLTILFLGSADNPNKTKIAGFLAHAVSTMAITRFGLDVDYRGELGDDKADVLFFQDHWELPRLRDFRSMLLKDNNIRSAYDSVEQFPEWHPHLTLGYPESPAKKTDEQIYWVQFDKIALWDDNYSGLELQLKSDYPMEVMMSDQAALGRQFLAHYGIKGMKWGIRRDRTARDVQTTEKIGRRTKVKAEGGEHQPAAPDAVKVAATTQKLKRSGTAALSNDELREVIQRAQLEQQAVALTTSKGKKFVKEITGQQAKQQVNAQINAEAQRQRQKRQ